MNVSESKFRQILREEARKVLRELDAPTSPEPSATSATTSQEWKIVNDKLDALISSLGSKAEFEGAQRIVIAAKLGWANCKDKPSNKLNAAVDAMAALDAGNQPSKLAAALVSLSGGTAMAIVGAAGNLSSGLGPTDQQSLAAALEAVAPVIVNNIVKHSSPAPTPTVAGASYTVSKGESISAILKKKYNPSVPLSNASMKMYKTVAVASNVDTKTFVIQPGQILQLPTTLTGSAGTVHNLILK